MFLRATTRKKDGKEHRYSCIVENRRLSDGRVLQRHVLYLVKDQRLAGVGVPPPPARRLASFKKAGALGAHAATVVLHDRHATLEARRARALEDLLHAVGTGVQ
jgi:hypothetical protein